MGINKKRTIMENTDKFKRAKKKVEQLKGFHIHLAVYVVINSLIALGNMLASASRGESLLQWPMLITPLFWGIGLAMHGLHVYGLNLLFGRKWEERQIAKYMEQDRRDAGKYQ